MKKSYPECSIDHNSTFGPWVTVALNGRGKTNAFVKDFSIQSALKGERQWRTTAQHRQIRAFRA
jgi:hypothetical protein